MSLFSKNKPDPRQLFHAVLLSDNTETIKSLLDQGIDINVYGATTLRSAALFQRTETVKFLLNRGVDINAKDKHGCTALYKNCCRDKTKMVKLLLDLGADINVRTNDGCHALHHAASSGVTETVKLLLDRGVDINVKDNDGQHALHYVALSAGCVEDIETMKLLLDRGVDINVKDNDGNTALHHAATGMMMNLEEKRVLLFLETVKLLLDRSVDINAKNNDGNTALHNVAKAEYVLWEITKINEKTVLETVKLFLKRGINVNIKNKDGKAAIYYAQKSKHKERDEIVQLLLKAQSFIDNKNDLNEIDDDENSTNNDDNDNNNDINYDNDDDSNDKDEEKNEFTAPKNDVSTNENEPKTNLQNTNTITTPTTRSQNLAWSCFVCTYLNDMNNIKCEICEQGIRPTTTLTESKQPEKEHEEKKELTAPKNDVSTNKNKPKTNLQNTNTITTPTTTSQNLEWSCFVCTYLNDMNNIKCEICEQGIRPTTTVTESKQPAKVQEEKKENFDATIAQKSVPIDGNNKDDDTDIDGNNEDDGTKQDKIEQLLLQQERTEKPYLKQFFDAVKKGDMETIKSLLNQGADVNVKDNYGRYALHYAAWLHEDPETAKLLLDQGADVNVKDDDGRSALHFAAINGHTKTVELLLDWGVDMNVKDNNEWNALHYASRNGHTETVKLLLDRGVDINIKGYNGWTALHYAAEATYNWGKYEETVSLLLNRGIDVNAKNNDATPAIYYAVQAKKHKIVKILLKAGAEPFGDTVKNNKNDNEDNKNNNDNDDHIYNGAKEEEKNEVKVIFKNDAAAKETHLQACLEAHSEAYVQPPPEPLEANLAPESKTEPQKVLQALKKINAQKEEKKIYLWLENVVQLSQYFDEFIKEGFDSMEIITKTLTEKDLKDIIGIKKAGHRKIIMHCINELKQANEPKDDEEIEGMVIDDVYADVVDTNNNNQYKNETAYM